jgi:hypothetical protein
VQGWMSCNKCYTQRLKKSGPLPPPASPSTPEEPPARTACWHVAGALRGRGSHSLILRQNAQGLGAPRAHGSPQSPPQVYLVSTFTRPGEPRPLPLAIGAGRPLPVRDGSGLAGLPLLHPCLSGSISVTPR